MHVVVAWYQAGRGNKTGCERQLEKAARRLGPFSPAHRGVDVAALLRQVEAAQALGSLELRPLDVPQPDVNQQAVEEDAQPPVVVEEE